MTDDAVTPGAPATKLDFDPVPALVEALGLPAKGVAAVIALLDEDNTVPFIARYRKERTGGLDEVQIRAIETQRAYIVELEERRAAILASVGEQGKLTPELEAKLRAATGKAELEDLYAPYRPRRKTRASVARERGLEPLAHRILAQGDEGVPAAEAAAFVNEHVKSADDALAGARDIVAEMVADTAEVRTFVRQHYADHGKLVSTVVPGKGDEPTKFEQYYQFEETVKTIPSHRFLAIRRGEAEGVLRAHVAVDIASVEAGILRLVKHAPGTPWGAQLEQAVSDALKRLLAPSVENDVRAELKTRSDHAAVEIFAGNLRNLMLAAPLGSASVLGVDPGLRTGCKCAAIDATGKFLGTVTIYISQGDAQLAKAKDDFIAFVREHKPRAIAVGNGTGGREAEAFVKKALGDAGLREGPDAPFVVQVNEAGASVYSASDLAREEFPELDLTIRGAISIARRLQDPLAELVKIEPKSIGVGQYQHDVHQPLLGKKLGDVVESCVNHVGVELNTASAQLLGYVAGIGKSLAKKIVVHRDTNGAFASRSQLQEVSGLGPKAFEQAAGFLRIHGATNPLDMSAVHPERYPLVEQMATNLGVPLPELIGNQDLVDKIDLSTYVQEDVGEPTLRDIVSELAKPGRDPRAEFAPPNFRDDVTTMEDLKPGMVLEGIVTNVTAFGAFVDIGVHNDGLVHVSQLAEKFVKDPSEVVKVGDKLKVRVLEVDNQRKRIALSARPPAQRNNRNDQRGPRNDDQNQQQQGRGRGPRNDQQGRGPRNDQQQQGQGGGEQHQGQRNDQGRGPGRGPRNDQQGRGPRNDQQGRGPRNDQQGRGPRNDQQGRGPRNDQGRGYDQHGGPRNDQQGGPRYDQQGGPRNDQHGGPRYDQQGGPNNDQQGGPNNDQQFGPGNDGPNNDQQGGPNNDQQFGPGNDGTRNDQQFGVHNDQHGGPRNDQRGGQRYDQQGGQRNDQQGGQRYDQQGGPRNDQQSGQRYDQHGGPRNDQQGGPRNDQQGSRRNDQGRGPRNDQGRGPRNDQGGPRYNQQGGPRYNQQGGPRNDQQGGPRNDQQRGPRNDQQGGPRNDQQGGPRNDQQAGGPRRDDRGPRRDDRGPRPDDRRDDRGPRREGPPPENWGVSGFVNNPFAKLKPDKNDGPK